MPYILQRERDRLDGSIRDLFEGFEELPNDELSGKLNYIISKLIKLLLKDKLCYARANTILGVLEAVKQEFYRRSVAPYEDKKIKENGDI